MLLHFAKPQISRRGNLIAAVALASLMLLLSRSVLAADVWKERTEEVYDREARENVRVTFRAWDPHPELNLEFDWKPENYRPSQDRAAPASPGVAVTINGEGEIVWRPQGARKNDPENFYSVYKGDMKDGRPDGAGSLSMRAGLTYVGAWHDGLMDGHGILKLENGDDYDGDFARGQMSGRGRYGSSVDGTVYVGEFKNGLRDGIGTLTLPDGLTYRTTWREGKEIGREPIVGDAAIAGSPEQRTGPLALRLLIDRKKIQDLLHADEYGPPHPYYVYEAANMPGSINVQLASKAVMDLWKGSEITQRPYQIDDIKMFPPVLLLADITNQRDRSVRVTDSYLQVEHSTSDFLPYLQAIGGNLTSCMESSNTDGHYDPSVLFENLGWGPVRNAKVVYSFGDKPSQLPAFTAELGTFDTAKGVSLEHGLRDLGVDTDRISRFKFKCTSASDVPACLKQVEASGTLGRLAGHVFTVRTEVRAKVRGHIDFEWTGVDGTNNRHSAPLSVDIPLFFFSFGVSAECGYGIVDRSGKPVQLSLDRQNYRIPLEWRAELAQGQNSRFALSIGAAKSSGHTFRLVLELADGATLTSRPVNLTYFRPRL
jgi:hypothetical protein